MAAKLATESRADATKRAYSADWMRFEQWCRAQRRKALPASEETLILYVVAALERYRVATIDRQVAAVVDAHVSRGLPSPAGRDLRDVMSGARRQPGAGSRPKAAITPDHLRAMCAALRRSGASLWVRDRAILTLGFAAALRRSELAALDVGDVRFVRQGMTVTVRRSKTDQEGEGRVVGVFFGRRALTCPVRAVRAWLRERGGAPGPLFPGAGASGHITPERVYQVVLRAVEMIGLERGLYGAHSLRAGFVTAAAEAGVPETVIMQRTGHRSVQTVARYVRPASVFSVDALARAL